MVKNSFSLNLDKVNNISLADHKEYANNVRRGKCVVVASVNFLQSLFTLCVLVCCLLCDIYLAKSKYSTICFSTIQSALTDAFK